MSDSDKAPEAAPSTPRAEYDFPALHAEPTESAPNELTPTPSTEIPPAASGPSNNAVVPAPWALRHKSWVIFIGFVVLVAAMWGINRIRNQAPDPDESEQGASAPDEIPVNAVEAKLGRFQDTINAVGTLKGEAEIELRFQVDGRIDELNILEGAKVRRGEMLGRLSDRDSMLKVERAKNELEQTEKLYQLGGVSKTKLSEARINLDVAQFVNHIFV